MANLATIINNIVADSGTALAGLQTALGYTPANQTTTITINGTTYDLSSNRSWTIGTTILNGTGFVKANGTTITYDNSTYYLASNPSGFTSNTGTVTSVSGTGTVSGLTLSGTVTTSGNLTLGGTLSLTSGQVTTALGFTPYNATNPAGYITSSGSISGNAATAGGLAVATGRNNSANQIVRTDANGYIQAGYINSSNGNEGNNSSPSRVWGTNGSDDYLRTYLTSALSVNYASSAGSAGSASSVPWSGVTSKPAAWLDATNLTGSNAPNTTMVSGFYNDYAGSGNPVGTWFSYVNVRHENPSNVYGHQHGMSFYDNDFWFRSYAGGSYQSWAKALSTQNYSSYAVPLNTNGIYTIGQGDGNAGFIFYGSNYGAGYAGRIYQNNVDGNTYFSARNGSSSFTEVGYLAYTGLYMSYYGSYSDIRLKNVIETNPDIDLSGIDVIKYTLKDETISHVVRYGYSAQQVQEILPDVVNTNMNIDGSAGTLTLNYNDLHTLKIAALEKKVKELQEQLNQILNK